MSLIKKTIIFLGLFLIMSSLAAALNTPYPVYGRVFMPDNITAANGAIVNLTLVGTITQSMSDIVDSGWYAHLDLGNLPQGYSNNDLIILNISLGNLSTSYQTYVNTSLGGIHIPDLVLKEFNQTIANNPPYINPIADITVNETDLVIVRVNATDPDGDNLTIMYGWPLNQSGMWKTTYNDAGVYKVNISVSDGLLTTTTNFTINVGNQNRAPVIQPVQDIYVNETELVIVRVNATEPDGDNLTINYGWPLNQSGMWMTTYNDAGVYKVNISVSDGLLTTTAKVMIYVLNKNRNPIIQPIQDIYVNETELVIVRVNATDPDGDNLTTMYGWPLNQSGMWRTTYNDAGIYKVNVTASDGRFIGLTTFIIHVANVNRPFSLSVANISVLEGNLIVVRPIAYDPDNDNISYMFGWPLNASGMWQTHKGEIGCYLTNITATDGKFRITRPLVIEVLSNITIAGFNGGTTKLSGRLNLSKIQHFTLEKTSYGRIEFLDSVNLDYKSIELLNKSVIINQDLVAVNSSAIKALSNKKARITLYNISVKKPVIYCSEQFTLIKSNKEKPCKNAKIISYRNHKLVFEVEHFSTYYVAERNRKLTNNDLHINYAHPYREYIKPGETLLISTEEQNIGSSKMKNMRITASLPELGIYAYSDSFDVKQHPSMHEVSLRIPNWAPKGDYTLRITISNDKIRRVKHRLITIT